MQIPNYAKKVLAVMNLREKDLTIPDSEIFLGTIKTGRSLRYAKRTGQDVILSLKKYPKQIAGIRTYYKSPYFMFYWKEKNHKRYASKCKKVDSIIDAFEYIYNSISFYLPKSTFKIDNRTYALLLIDGHIAIVYDFDRKEAITIDSKDLRHKTFNPLESDTAQKLRETALFDYYGYGFTVKEYLFGKYLNEYGLLLANYELLKRDLHYDVFII
jgi:uncharacterized phage-like protein YoqJ